jgi:hypothetical protein
MKAPSGDPGDFYVAQCAESTLLMPEKAKSAGPPKRFQHVSPFAFFQDVGKAAVRSTLARLSVLIRWTNRQCPACPSIGG